MLFLIAQTLIPDTLHHTLLFLIAQTLIPDTLHHTHHSLLYHVHYTIHHARLLDNGEWGSIVAGD